MSWLYRLNFLLLLLPFLTQNAVSQNLKINELMSSNREVVFDEDNETPDWIEIINFDDEVVSLGNYFLSDDPEELYKWQLPEGSLSPNQPQLIFASDKDRRVLQSHWYSLVKKGDYCTYKIPDSDIDASWRTVGFNDDNWTEGPTGIGYGDDDDSTEIEKNTVAVFLRHEFSVEQTGEINSLWLHMDYDDGFVAFLNGTEIARAGLGDAGTEVLYTATASAHEAQIYSGGNPEGFDVTEFVNQLNIGENVLAIQVHNTGANSSDLTAIPFLTAGFATEQENLEDVTSYTQFSTQNSHTNFKLSSSGETIFLTHETEGIVDSVTFGEIPGEYSFGRHVQNTTKWVYFMEPTPGKINNTRAINGIVENEVQFSIEDMFLDGAQYLDLFGAADDEIIRYTTTGGNPIPNSSIYSEPILVNKNTVIKAAIFKEGFIQGKTTSRTYLFGVQTKLPVVSVSVHPNDLWNNETGIYVKGNEFESDVPHYGANFWEDWEKPAYIEMAEPDGTRAFSLNCGVKIFGGWSRAHPQKSLSVFFRNEYRDSGIEDYQIFESKPINSFSSIVLRNSGNDYGFAKMRDAMMTSLVRNLDTDIAAYQPSVLYLNGEYWGLINIREKLNEDYIESNHGIDADSIDLLERHGQLLEGSNDKYWQLYSFIDNNSLAEEQKFNAVADQIDLSNYIDYMLSEIYFDNRDWPGNNIKYWRPQSEGGKWRWIMFDTDFGFGIYNEEAYLGNTLDFALATDGEPWPNPPWSTLIFRKLLENEQFKNRFINRFADVLNTTFLPSNVAQHIDSLAENIEPEITRNEEKWGSPNYSFWQQNISRMKNFASKRPENVREHIKLQFALPAWHEASFSVLPSTGGTYTLNSLHINEPVWKGKYFEEVPVRLTAKPNPGYTFHSWNIDGMIYTQKSIDLNINSKMNIRVLFQGSDEEVHPVVINEINYNSPTESDAGDWIELYNPNSFDIDISGWILKDDNDSHSFEIPTNTLLKSNDYLVICRNETGFITVHPAVTNYIGELDFGFSSSGDAVRLFNDAGELIDMVQFGAGDLWPGSTNGSGPTLELRNYNSDNSLAESWEASVENSGTPGARNSILTKNLAKFDEVAESLNVYPNPFSDQIKIVVENMSRGSIDVQINSLAGKMVYRKRVEGNSLIWNGKTNSGGNLPPGVYICRVLSENNLFTSRIMLIK